ncbi:MAG: hypothetical protein AAF550_07590 [Myxococcota bacterium]
MLRYVSLGTLFLATGCTIFLATGCTITTPGSSITYSNAANARPATTSAAQPASQMVSGPISSDPREAVNQIDSHLRSQGFSRVGPVSHNPNMPVGGLIAYAINAQRGQCYMAIAVGASGGNLNLAVIDPAGNNVGHNVLPDAHPWIGTCATQQGRYIARLQRISGSGSYYFALYQGPRPIDLSHLFGDRGAAQVQSAAIDQATGQRLASLDAQLSPSGFQRTAEPEGVQLSESEDRRFILNLQQGYCYTFASLGGPGASDTDVFVTDGSGNQLAQDSSVNLDATVDFCPASTGTYALRALMYRGSGPIFIAAWAKPQQAATASSGAANTSVITGESHAGASLDENYRVLDSEMRARGYEPIGTANRGSLEHNRDQNFSLNLEGGKCYAIVAVGDNRVRDLDLFVLDSSRREIDRDIETDARPIVRVCPEQSGAFTMRVRMHNGQGEFLYQPYRWPRGTRGPFGLNGLIYVRLAEVTSLLSVEGFEPDLDAAPGRGVLRSEGQSTQHSVALGEQACFAVLVVGGSGLHDLDLSLISGGRELASDGSTNAFPTVRHCTDAPARLSLKIEAQSGKGEYFYQIFRRAS